MPSTRLAVPARSLLWKPQGQQLSLDLSHPLAKGLLHCYLFTEGGGTLARNLLNPTQVVTLSSGATWVNSLYGPALHFNASATGLATLSSAFSPSATTWSVEILARPTAIPSTPNFASLLVVSTTDGLYLANNAGVTVGWDVDSTTQDNAGVSTLPTANLYYHLVFTYDGTTAKTYQNGLSYASAAMTAANFTYGWNLLGAETGGVSPFTGDMAWVRIWDARVLTQNEAMALYGDPFGMVVSAGETARTYSILSGRPLVAPSPSPVLSAAILAGARPAVVAPFPNLVVLASPPPSGSVAIAGEADGIGTGTTLALTVTKALILESDGTAAATTLALTVTKALTLEADGTAATATTLALTVSKALTLEADGVGAGTTLSLTVTKALTLESDGTGSATTLSLTVTKALTLEADGVGTATTLALTVTKAIAGTASGTGAATTLTLTVGAATVAITGTASGTGAASALTLTVSVAITGQASGTGTGVALTLTVTKAIAGTANGSAALTTLAIAVVVTGPTSIAVSDVALWATALSDAPLWATAVSDAPLASTGLGDAATGNTSVGDVALAQTALTDA